MRQLIARIDDELHARLKARAAVEGRSLNAFVQDVLQDAVADEPRSLVRRRLAREGRLAAPPMPAHPPDDVAVVRATQGAGAAASEALADERRRR